MPEANMTKATLGRVPMYLEYLKSPFLEDECISATKIAKALHLGEVQVRKDLNIVSGSGKPKIGYQKKNLISDLENILGNGKRRLAVLVGAGRLGTALMGFEGFSDYGLEIEAAFDRSVNRNKTTVFGKPVYPIEQFRFFCQMHDVRIGIITVPAEEAREVCDLMVESGIEAIWNFAPVMLSVPDGILVQQENLALSLAHLSYQSSRIQEAMKNDRL